MEDRLTPDQTQGSGGEKGTKSLAGEPGGRGEPGRTTQGGESPDHKGEKRDSRQAGLERPQTPGGGKRAKRSDGPSIIKLQELLPKGDSLKQVGAASGVKELNEANQGEGGVELRRGEGREDTPGSRSQETCRNQKTAEGSNKEQVPEKRKSANQHPSTLKLRLWENPTPLSKLEKTPARAKEKSNHPDGKTLLEIRKQARTAQLVQPK